MRNQFTSFRGFLLAAAIAFVPLLASAQSTVAPRITAAVDEARLTTLTGNTHPLARAEFDRGAAPLDLPMQRMLLVLKRSPVQETVLDALLDQQQDKSSPNYHQWLTPNQFGQQFGPADQDIQTVTSWLQSHGFEVTRVSNGRTVIEFSGSAAQVRDALHTEIHKYVVNGEEHWANASDPQIPAALTPVVAGIDTLYNFPRQSMYHLAGVASRSKATGDVNLASPSLFTLGGNCGVSGVGCHALGPYDFGTIYDVLPLWTATPTHIDGSGQTIAVVAESNINIQDVRDFRNYFGLPPKDPQIIVSGSDPGLVPSAETEADLDVEWSGAIAPNATIDLVVSESTEVSLGADLAAEYIVNNNIAPVMNVSFGICEAALGTSGNLFFNQLWQQAAAQGITVLVATGDSGSAVCDRRGGTPPLPAVFGLQVSGFSSTPYNVAVGGTDFNDLTNISAYWNSTNSAPPGNPSALPTVSAKSYIPETTWNDTCTNAVFGNPVFFSFSSNPEINCNNAMLVNFVVTVGGSGGKSDCTIGSGHDVTSCSGGYAKPSWQTGVGVPTDGKRDVPDISLYAASGSPSGSFYVVCEADALLPGSDSCDSTNVNSNFLGVGGTSASAPSFAAIMALINQETNSRQGNANYILYKLAAQQPSAFHDVPAGGTIAMPCATGSTPDCVTSHASDRFGVLSGYSTTAGYDLATGLGSVDANNLVNKWSTVTTTLKSSATTLALSPSPVTITHGQSVNVNIGVTGTPGTPTGNVSLIANTAPPTAPTVVTQQGVQGFPLPAGSSSVSTTTNVLPGSPVGQPYTVFARYAGDGTFASSDSPPVSVTVNPEASSAKITLELFDPLSGLQTNPNATTAQYGSLELLRMNVTSQSGDTCAQNAPGQLGCPTGNVTITNNGNALDAGMYPLNIQGYAEDQNVQLPGGTDMLKLTYGGDNSFTANNSTSTISITKAPTTTTLNVPSKVMLGGSNALTANIASAGFGTGPTGQATFFTGATQLGNPVAVTNSTGGSSSSVPQAQATLTTSQLPLGNNSVTAQFSGDGNYTASTSLPATVDVQILTELTLNTSSQTINHGSSVTFTAKVNPTQTGGPGPTGTITFSDGGFNTLAQVPLTNGQAQFTTSTLPGGNDQINAEYSGDANYTISGADTVVVVNLLATTTTVMTSNSSIPQGSSVTLTAIIAPVQSGGPALTGTVQFFSALTLQGGDTLVGGAIPVMNGQAQITTSSLPLNIQIVGALYSGDANYASSNGTIAQAVTPTPTFMVAANPTTIPVIAPGQSGSTVLTFTAQNGFSSNGNVMLTSANCPALPSEATCSFNPSTINLATNGTAMTTLTILTTAPSGIMPGTKNRPTISGGKKTGVEMALACLLCMLILWFAYKEKRRGLSAALGVVTFAMLLASAACGGGGGGGITNPGTPVADTAITVTITINGVTQIVPGLMVNVE